MTKKKEKDDLENTKILEANSFIVQVAFEDNVINQLMTL